jgi:hypothetical protein
MPMKKPSSWITHVKQEAVKLNLKYNEALKDPRVKKSYKKM